MRGETSKLGWELDEKQVIRIIMGRETSKLGLYWDRNK